MEKYYVILGLPVIASREDVKKAFRNLAKQWHPDRFHNDSEKHKEAEKKFKLINEAYRYLLSCQQAKQDSSEDTS
jgi:curved DNA-binding protein CbpA